MFFAKVSLISLAYIFLTVLLLPNDLFLYVFKSRSKCIVEILHRLANLEWLFFLSSPSFLTIHASQDKKCNEVGFFNFETIHHDVRRLIHAVMTTKQTYLYSERMLLCGLHVMLHTIFVLFFKNINLTWIIFQWIGERC